MLKKSMRLNVKVQSVFIKCNGRQYKNFRQRKLLSLQNQPLHQFTMKIPENLFLSTNNKFCL
jgi:hypothetical protein